MKVISEIQIVPIKPINGLVGFASFVLYEAIYCGSVGIMTRPFDDSYRLVYPTKKVAGKDMDVYHPINKQVGRLIEDEVMKQINDVMSISNGRYRGFSITE
jgi:hypothetical protein